MVAQGRASELATLVQQRTVEAVATRDVHVMALAKLAESRDPGTGEHLDRMRKYSQVLAEHLNEEGPYVDQFDQQFLEDLNRSSPLHDIGKVGIPDNILMKPGKLTSDEWDIMKQHPVIGANTLRAVLQQYPLNPILKAGVDIA